MGERKYNHEQHSVKGGSFSPGVVGQPQPLACERMQELQRLSGCGVPSIETPGDTSAYLVLCDNVRNAVRKTKC